MAAHLPLAQMMLPIIFWVSILLNFSSASHNFWQETLPGSGLTYTVPTAPYATYVQTANGPMPVYYQPQPSWLMSSQPFLNDPVSTMTPVYVPLDTLRTNQQSGPQIYSIPSDQDSDEDETAVMIDQDDKRSPDLPVPCTDRRIPQTRAIAACILAMLLLSVMIGLLTYFVTKGSHHGY